MDIKEEKMSLVKILLVDDDEDDFIITRDILKESNNSKSYQLTWCNNFSEAINSMLKGYYDIYLVDYRLGRHSGIDLLNEAIKSNCREPIIILTSKGDFDIDQEAMRLGAADYLIKDTLNSQMLERSIRYAITQNNILQQLKKSESKFRIIFERAKDPMLMTTPDGLILDANSAAIKYFDTSLEEILKLNASEFYKNSEDRDAFIAAMDANGAVTDLELDMVSKAGVVKTCSISSFLQVSQDGRTEIYYSIIHDLMSRISNEKNSSLTAIIENTKRIAKSLAEEIQNPLSNVNLALDELYNSSRTEWDLLDIIKYNCGKVNSLANELVSKTEISVNIVEAELYQLVSDLLNDIYSVTGDRILNPLVDDGVRIKCDPQNLKSSISILIEGVAEAVELNRGQLKINLSKHISQLRIDIVNTGLGVEFENLEKFMEPLFTTKSRGGKPGFSVAISIIEAHQGKINYTNLPSQGNIISILLPL